MSVSLSSPLGAKLLQQAIHSDSMLLGLDLDGTLAPLCEHPDQVRIPLLVQELLLDLENRCQLAILSGRSRKNLDQLCGFLQKTHLVGNHGLESPWSSRRLLRSAQQTSQKWHWQLESLELPTGSWIENKQFGISLHFRKCPDPVTAGRTLTWLAHELNPTPRIIPGKCVVNLVPKNTPDKGRALADLHARLEPVSIIYIGDDITDESAFRWLQSNIPHEPDARLGIQVGLRGDSAAHCHVETQAEVPMLLQALATQLPLLAETAL